MTEEQFVEEYSGSPLDLEDIARILVRVKGSGTVECNCWLRESAEDFLQAQETLLAELDAIGFELG